MNVWSLLDDERKQKLFGEVFGYNYNSDLMPIDEKVSLMYLDVQNANNDMLGTLVSQAFSNGLLVTPRSHEGDFMETPATA